MSKVDPAMAPIVYPTDFADEKPVSLMDTAKEYGPTAALIAMFAVLAVVVLTNRKALGGAYAGFIGKAKAAKAPVATA